MSDSAFLYMGFRSFVSKEDLERYDNEYMVRKVHSYKFMIPFIYRYVDVNYHLNQLQCSKDSALFAFFLNVYCERNSELSKAIKEARDTPRMVDRKFLYK